MAMFSGSDLTKRPPTDLVAFDAGCLVFHETGELPSQTFLAVPSAAPLAHERLEESIH